ncbi:MAG TPA: dihydrolipoamide acetyltransferase family protein [Anaerolineales bacterium]|nr:dihydrolipoamide acetyltransferase family protein [Anaerolineales bacterium]
MAETISMPKLGFDMAEGTLVRWVKNEGENINKGDILAEIETDKATVEVESSASGVVRKLLVEEGSVVPVGDPIAVVGSADEKIEETPTKVVEPKAEKKTDDQGGEELKTESEEERRKKEGSKTEETPPPPAPPSGTMQTQPTPAPVSQAAAPAQEGPIKASPLAKKIARDKNVDLWQVQGTGPGGRVVRKDVEAALSSGQPSAVSRQPAPAAVPVSRADETIQLTRLRQAIARRMTESTTSVPHFYVTHEYKMDALMALRKQINDYLGEDEKLSVNDFIIKAVALALREFPNLNASFAGDKVIRHGAVNVGVAVSVEGGLLTVVNRNTDQQPLRAISSEVKRMVAGAREGKVKPDDIQGSTFSISNMGMFDVENFAAIINPPEAGILAVGSARQVPVVENGEVKVGWRMKATISVDHRVSDGAEAAQFMQKLAEFLENPVRMLV